MRIAGVRLPAGESLWVDAGELSLGLLDEVTVLREGKRVKGRVFAHSSQVLRIPDRIAGVVISYTAFVAGSVDCAELPGSDLPPLGTVVVIDGGESMVVGIDVPLGTVIVRSADGQETRQLASDIVALLNP